MAPVGQASTHLRQVAQKVRAILDTQRQPGIAILDRSRTDRNIITRWLNLYGIRYTVDAQKDIFSAGPVCDIYNFLRCCVYPSDTNAYCAYLCSPLAGLSVQSAAAVMAALTDSGKTDFDPLAGTEQAAALLSPEEAEKFRAAQDFFRSERHRTLSRPLTDTVQLLLYQEGQSYTIAEINLASSPEEAILRMSAGVFVRHGFRVGLNEPYSNSISPAMPFPYSSMMIELNKRTYMDQDGQLAYGKATRIMAAVGEMYGRILSL